MKKTVVYVLPVDEYGRYDAQNLSVDSLNELDNVDRYSLEDFIEACNNEEINLVNVWLAYREIEEEKPKGCVEILVITADHEVSTTAIAIRQDTMEEVLRLNNLPAETSDDEKDANAHRIREELVVGMEGPFHIEWYEC